MKIPVFMYHAVYESTLEQLEGADPFYAVSLDRFIEQIELCKKNNKPICSISDIIIKNTNENKCCIFTFDDGHISNYKAAKVLHQFGYTADFFINSANIGVEHYLNEQHIIDMVQWGMSIQSHGHNHFYINDLSTSEVHNQLLTSKKLIEDITKKNVNIFAPPGGRINSMVEQIAFDHGYDAITNSIPGLWVDSSNKVSIPRLPILNSTGMKVYESWLQAKSLVIFKLYFIYQLKKLMKVVLGNGSYDKLRIFLLKLLS
ncbi:MAG: polysaccharide deacetylase family protein [Methylococcales bacterium]